MTRTYISTIDCQKQMAVKSGENQSISIYVTANEK